MFLGHHVSSLFGNQFRLISCLLLLGMLTVSVTAVRPDHDEIRRLVNEGLAYEDLRGYYDQETGLEQEKIPHPRLFPLCIQATTLEGYSPLSNFAPIWKEINEQHECEKSPLLFHEYNASLHSMKENTEWIESITLSRINTPEVDARNMRQWMHITVKTPTPMRALYMQTVVGPLGLPSGEFSLEFPCEDLPGVADPRVSMVLHCDFRSKAELNHPTAFFGGYEGRALSSEFHVHYKWTDISCLETPFLQFILIAVKDFKVGSPDGPKWGVDFQPLFSPVFTNFEFDSVDGAITPYYIDWKSSMTCTKTAQDPLWAVSTRAYHDTQFEDQHWQESQMDKLIVNEDYDECLSNDQNSERDEDRRECSPGPFTCPSEMNLKMTFDEPGGADQVKGRRQREFDEITSMAGCSPCIFPREEVVMSQSCLNGMLRFHAAGDDVRKEFLRSAAWRNLDPKLYLDYSDYLNSSVDGRYHGAIAIFVYMFLTPLGIFLARFYRGTPIHHLHKDDFWVMIHGAIHLVGLHLLWISVGFVTTLDEGLSRSAVDCYIEAEKIMKNAPKGNWTQESYIEWLDACTFKARIHSHSGLGIFSMVIHNLNVIMSFFRSRSDTIRNIQVIIHSHLGYIDVLVSVFTIFFAVHGQACTELLGYCIFMMLFTVAMFLIASCVTNSEDDALGVDPKRYKWPILEPIRFAQVGPQYEAKMAILGLYGAVLFFVWVLSVVSLTRIHSSETTALSSVGVSDTISGIFESCNLNNFFKPNLANLTETKT